MLRRALAAVLAGCWSAAALAGNLLELPAMNRGFGMPEEWTAHAWAGRVAWVRVPDAEIFGVRLTSAGTGWVGATSSRRPVPPGRTLTVGAWIWIDGEAADRDDKLFLRSFAAGRFLSQDGPSLAGPTGVWRYVSGVVEPDPEATRWDLSLQLRSPITVWMTAPVVVSGRVELRNDSMAPSLPAPEWIEVKGMVGLPPDSDGDGIADSLEKWLGGEIESGLRRRSPRTSFQTNGGYVPEHDLATDIVIVARQTAPALQSWALRGYEVHSMAGFRAGKEYAEAHMDEVQTMRDGTPRVIAGSSFYMVPTERRREIFRERFLQAVENGAVAVCPEEPEFFAATGYSEAFRKRWEEEYGRPWAPPHETVQDRWDAERLKARMERELLEAIYSAVQERSPGVRRFLLAHSPVNYSEWAITFAHADAVRTLPIDGFVGQVWTGTARTPLPADGERRERTFEHAFLEYSSVFHLTRGTGIETWFLMDPLEDHPGRTMDDYRSNYHRTLAASLLFPGVVRFEVLPWPNRIYGRVPDAFAAEIGVVTRVLEDVADHPSFEPDWGTEGLAVFVSDTMMWERGGPDDRGMADFHGLCAPLIVRGIPVQVAHLDRAAEEGYLDDIDFLLLTYEGMKPPDPAVHRAIAARVRSGAALVLCLGDDPFRSVASWWREEGFAAPEDHLLRELGLPAAGAPEAISEPLSWEWTDPAGGPSWTIPRDAPVTPLPEGGIVLAKAGGRPVAARYDRGDGSVLLVGIPPRLFLESVEAGDVWRRLTASACAAEGREWKESPWLAALRGPYLVVGSISGEFRRAGRFLDLLGDGMPETGEARAAPGQAGVFLDLDRLPESEGPRILAGSSRVLAVRSTAEALECVVRGPRGVRGVMRIDPAGRKVVEATGIDADGNPVPIEVDAGGSAGWTVLLRYPESHLGQALRIRLER